MREEHHHRHGHSGHHAHGPDAPAGFGRAFAIGIVLNTAFVAIEAGYGIASNSMALLADAGHNLGDVLGLVVAWVAAALSKRQPTAELVERFGIVHPTLQIETGEQPACALAPDEVL